MGCTPGALQAVQKVGVVQVEHSTGHDKHTPPLTPITGMVTPAGQVGLQLLL
jgi:hypothetical protein